MHQAKERVGARLASLLILLLLLYIFFGISRISFGVQAALEVCLVSLIPSLFPFMLLSDALLHTAVGKGALATLATPFAKLLRCSREGAGAYLVGVLFGFPLGAQVLCELVKEGCISKKEAERLLLFCNNTGPAFAVGAVGVGMLGSAAHGWVLYGAQCLISLLFGIFLSFFSHDAPSCATKPRTDFRLAPAIARAVRQMLTVCGCVLLFAAVQAALSPLLPTGTARCLLSALLEVGGATAAIARGAPDALILPLCGFAICFSGLSVYLQVRTLTDGTDLSTRHYPAAKLLQGALAFLLLVLLRRIDFLPVL